MKKGLIRLQSQGTAFLVSLFAKANMAASYQLTLPEALPTETSLVSINASGQIGYSASGAVSSVGLATSQTGLFSIPSSPITSSGNLEINFNPVAAGLVLCGPGTAPSADPTFKQLSWNYVSHFVGNTGTHFAAGNDNRLHFANTDTGTNSSTFQFGSGGVTLRTNLGVLEARNASNTAYADLRVKDIYVTGQQVVSNTSIIEYDDVKLLLNKDFTGSTPTEDGGIEVERGTLVNAACTFNESTDRWQVGLVGSERPVARFIEFSFGNTDLVSGILSLNHNLGNSVLVQIYDNTGEAIEIPKMNRISDNAVQIELTVFGTLSSSPSAWKAVVIG